MVDYVYACGSNGVSRGQMHSELPLLFPVMLSSLEVCRNRTSVSGSLDDFPYIAIVIRETGFSNIPNKLSKSKGTR